MQNFFPTSGNTKEGGPQCWILVQQKRQDPGEKPTKEIVPQLEKSLVSLAFEKHHGVDRKLVSRFKFKCGSTAMLLHHPKEMKTFKLKTPWASDCFFFYNVTCSFQWFHFSNSCFAVICVSICLLVSLAQFSTAVMLTDGATRRVTLQVFSNS